MLFSLLVIALMKMNLSFFRLLLILVTILLLSESDAQTKTGGAIALINRTTFPLINGLSNLLNLYQASANRHCTTAWNTTGTCLAKSDCLARSGVLGSACSSSIGTFCCDLFKFTCGARTDKNGTVFVNQFYPSGDNGTNTCQITIDKQKNVCQLRLDFEQFTLAQPDDNGQCTTDSFMIRTTVGERLPILCGENGAQHLYIDVGTGVVHSNPVVLSVVTNGQHMERRWKIHLNMIPCDSLNMAPSGCLQYFRSPSGLVQSFNYGPMIENKARYLSNLRYTACIRAEENFCAIKWQSEQPDSFAWGVPDGATNGTIWASGDRCHLDYIGIDQATPQDNNPSAIGSDRFCGQQLANNHQVFSRSKPFQLKIRSNNHQMMFNKNNGEQGAQKGFSLRFTQLPCVL